MWGVSFIPAGGGAPVVLCAEAAYPDSGGRIVTEELAAPADGVLRCEWNNARGWRAREVHFRDDPVAPAPAPAASVAAPAPLVAAPESDDACVANAAAVSFAAEGTPSSSHHADSTLAAEAGRL